MRGSNGGTAGVGLAMGVQGGRRWLVLLAKVGKSPWSLPNLLQRVWEAALPSAPSAAVSVPGGSACFIAEHCSILLFISSRAFPSFPQFFPSYLLKLSFKDITNPRSCCGPWKQAAPEQQPAPSQGGSEPNHTHRNLQLSAPLPPVHHPPRSGSQTRLHRVPQGDQ